MAEHTENSNDNLDEISKDELFQILDDIRDKNIECHRLNESEIILAIEDTIFKFFSLRFRLEEVNDETDGSLLFNTKGFLTSAANNSLLLKELYQTGMQLQGHIIMRSQFEQLNTLFAFLVDPDFFRRFSKSARQDSIDIITPKQVHTEKIMKQFLENSPIRAIWPDIHKMKKHLYSEFSKSAHGNLFYVTVGSMGIHEENEDQLSSGIGGVSRTLPRMINSAKDMNNYSQIMWFLIKSRLEELGWILRPESMNESKMYQPHII